ncbi:MAG: AbrB/MazE/SpoVT family DNA-binding domain-containing protein [bacterium]|nr:AbrB/MazE/SpoVT family DNA-binding domain-containing protein [bacterium]MDE0351903.1 AbrB/MazE/SpoVT family DNA-binding domain-containing protein [bacterium]
MIESTITSKGQTTLPKAVREALSVHPGDRVRVAVFRGPFAARSGPA